MPVDDIPRSLGRALDLLEAVLDLRACNLSTAAERTGLTPTTALRHLRGLEARGYVARDDHGLYSAGPMVHRAAALVRDQTPLHHLIEVAQPHLDTLAATTGESCYLAVAQGGRVSYVATAESPQRIRHVGWVGETVPLEGTAVGEALARPGVVVVRTGAVEADITAVSLALAPTPELAAAVSVVGPAHRLAGATERQTAAELQEMVATLSGGLGHRDTKQAVG